MIQTARDLLRDSAFAPHASGTRPAWIFSSDGSQLVFANAAGAAMLGLSNGRDTPGARIPPELAAQISRIAGSLRGDGRTRLERMRGLGSGLGRLVTCACSRIRLASKTAVLVVATEATGRALTLDQRARYLAEASDADAAFDANGRLLFQTNDARPASRINSLRDIENSVETLPVGNNADALTLAFFPAHSQPIKPDPSIAVASARPDLLDLSPIAEAISAMTKMPQQQNGHDRADAPEQDSGRRQAANHTDANHSDANHSDNAPQAERRHPLRFFWETDAQNRFTISSDDFIALAGPRTSNLLGRFWGEISAKLALDPEGRVAHALVSRDTWSGIALDWPTAAGECVPVLLSGIPSFDRNRTFRGYRGLGVWHGDTPAAPSETIRPDEAKPVDPSEAPPDVDLASGPAVESAGDATTTVIAEQATASQPVEAGAPEPETAPTGQAPMPAEAAASAPIDETPATTENVVPFRVAAGEPKPGALNAAERSAFFDLGSRLSARLKGADELARGLMEEGDPCEDPPYVPPAPVAVPQFQAHLPAQVLPDFLPEEEELAAQRPVLDQLPLGVLIYQGSNFLYANPVFLAFAGHRSLADFTAAGGLDSMYAEFDGSADEDGAQRLRIAASGSDDDHMLDGRLLRTAFGDETAMVLILSPASGKPAAEPAAEETPAADSPNASATEHSELAALLDMAVDGVVTLDKAAIILSANARAERLFGYDHGALAGHPFGDLFAAESERVAMARFDRLARGEVTADDDGREIIGRRHKGGLTSLQLVLGRADAAGTRFHALFRDMTRWKDAEKEMSVARQQAEKASAAKSEFLAKISHEMRTPLNAIIGFSEVMMEERFGPIGNERYRDYLKDINTSGGHLVSLLNDLLDLSKIEAGKLELSFERVDLNDITQQSVAIMQAQANRARVIMRTALSMNIPGIIADTRSVRQIVLNLLSNSIKFTGTGGQVIISTAASDRGDVMLRIRDTGGGRSEMDIETALQPFR
ncbi:histidine kinase dimerization/phospho-acceptor domain-containing protein, partial [Pseudorhodoplanes sp.]|uniref:PAS domain-containing sensor histidine kinase n=1 Tax=Pseudorhodoplanes sp. TaxID=1934341 RepID=UPI003D107391